MRRRTPQEKKEFEYTKDHVTIASLVHGTRKTWPRKEARATRTHRRRIRQILTSFQASHDEDVPDQFDPKSVRRKQVYKWGVIPLAEALNHRRDQRLAGTVRSFLLGNYDTAYAREHFVAFLSSQVGGRTEHPKELALYLQELMDIPQKYIWGVEQLWWGRKHRWICAFFLDEPEWEARVRAWISSFNEV